MEKFYPSNLLRSLLVANVIILFILYSANAQETFSKLEGTVKNEIGLPIEGALVKVKNNSNTAITDQNGNFSFDLIPGHYTLYFIHVSYQSRLMNIFFKTSGNVDILMTFKTTTLSEIIINSTVNRDNVDDTSTGVSRINIKEIENLPGFLGELDIIKSITLLPGVNTVGEGSGGFNVRGGRIDQNLILMDGVQLFNTSHVLGFFSIFNPDITNNFTLYKGNIPVQYGGRVSSVLDVHSIRGNKEKLNLKASVGTIISKLAFDGPINKHLTLALGGRITYADWILKKVKDLDVRNSNAGFNDFFGRMDYELNESNSFRISYYSSYDQFDFSNDFGYEWTNRIVNFGWKHAFSNIVISDFTASYLDYSSELFDYDLDKSSELNNGIDKWQIRQNFNIDLNRHYLSIGAEVIDNNGKNESIKPFGEESNIQPASVEKDHGREYAIYFGDEFKLNKKISINGGLRYNIYQNLGPSSVIIYDQKRSNADIIDTLSFTANEVVKTYTSLSPRISARIGLSDQNSIKLSYNRLYQYIHLISNTTASTPIDQWQVSNYYFKPITANNFSLGYYHNFDDNRWETSFEVFYKKLDNIIEYRNFADLLVKSNIETELLIAEGKAYGGEVLFTRKTNRWTGWLTYTYARSLLRVEQNEINKESINAGDWFPANYDQPHSIRFTSDLKLGLNGSFGASFTYNTGRPITAIQSDYLLNNLLVPNYTDRNKIRIPDYWRVDVSLTIGSVIRKVNDKLVFSIYNLFGRDNAYSVFFKRTGNLAVARPFKLSVLGAIFPSITYSINILDANK